MKKGEKVEKENEWWRNEEKVEREKEWEIKRIIKAKEKRKNEWKVKRKIWKN